MNINDEMDALSELVEDWRWNGEPEMQSVFGFHTARLTLRALEAMSTEMARLSKLTERADLMKEVDRRVEQHREEIVRLRNEARALKERLDRIEAYIEREHEKNREKRMTVSLTYNDWRNVLFALDSGKCAYPVLEAVYNLIWMQLPSPPPREGSG
jgi:chromosome segregation ATPase